MIPTPHYSQTLPLTLKALFIRIIMISNLLRPLRIRSRRYQNRQRKIFIVLLFLIQEPVNHHPVLLVVIHPKSRRSLYPRINITIGNTSNDFPHLSRFIRI